MSKNGLVFATKEALIAWLATLAEKADIFAPKREGKATLFRPYTKAALQEAQAENLLDRATVAPKALVLPQAETLLTYHKGKPEGENPASLTLATPLENAKPAKPCILFGARPCDVKGFVVLDRPYMQGPYKDPYYCKHRQNLACITQACPEAFSTCFCNWTYGSPSSEEGSDILFTAINTGADNGFVLTAITEKGLELLSQGAFPQATEAQIEACTQAHTKAAESLPSPSTLARVPEAVASRFADTAFWEAQTVKCLSCGACTYLCPTCQCFSITDEGTSQDGKRLRSWDSCMSSLFTREASGHNPRPDKAARMRNRISHKFSYYPDTYPQAEPAYSCVGCGRCVRSCPVNLDIREVVAQAVLGAALQATPSIPSAQPGQPAQPPQSGQSTQAPPSPSSADHASASKKHANTKGKK